MKKKHALGAMVLIFGIGSAFAAEITVKMNIVNEQGLDTEIGHMVVTESEYGLVFTPKLEKLPVGLHGFHVHENPSCAPKEINSKIVPAGAAGGHLDPKATKKHGLPWTNDNHLGDLPALTFDAEGHSTNPVLAPRLKMNDLKGRSLMIHVGGDNHSDHPAPLGGGGARMACGVV